VLHADLVIAAYQASYEQAPEILDAVRVNLAWIALANVFQGYVLHGFMAISSMAEDYKRSKRVAWRYYIEQYSVCELAAEVSGPSVLDLACGDGHYTRMFKKMGLRGLSEWTFPPK
jgi:hypothetical protein